MSELFNKRIMVIFVCLLSILLILADIVSAQDPMLINSINYALNLHKQGQTNKALSEINKILENPNLDVGLKAQAFYAKGMIVLTKGEIRNPETIQNNRDEAYSILKDLEAWDPSNKLVGKLSVAITYKYVYCRENTRYRSNDRCINNLYNRTNVTMDYSLNTGDCRCPSTHQPSFKLVDENGRTDHFKIYDDKICINDVCSAIGGVAGRYSILAVNDKLIHHRSALYTEFVAVRNDL